MFWDNFYNLCLENNITPSALTKELGLSNATATKWKKGTIPNGEVLIKLADYFNCSVDYLLGRTNFSNTENSLSPELEKLVVTTKDLTQEQINNLITFINSMK